LSANRGDARERPVERREGAKGGVRCSRGGVLLSVLAGEHELHASNVLRVANSGRRSEHQSIDEPEHRRIRADGEREGGHDADGEHRLAPQGSNGVAEVVSELVDETHAERG
jgi:hypothetical protein